MTTLVVAGGTVVLDGATTRADVRIEHGRIHSVGLGVGAGLSHGADAELDATGLIVAPGFIDLQCNGAIGHDLTSEPASASAVGRALVRYGVTAFCPTIVTTTAPGRRAAIDVELAQSATGARSLGLHFEGPLLSPEHAGAHPRHLLGPVGADELDLWCHCGAVRMVTLAPEQPGALDVISRLRRSGIVVSAGHTAMDATHLARAREAGLTAVSHLFNAMSAFHHRTPNAVSAVLDDEAIVASLICDGVHVDDAAVRLAHRMLGRTRIVLVSDATAALGAPHGTHALGRNDIAQAADGVRLADGTLAGSALRLDDAVRNYLAATHCPLDEAIATVTSTPADLLGLTDRGRIRPGARADLTVLDPELRATGTVIAGEVVWKG